MANYTVAVPWSGKDTLSDTDPAKVISGSDFNTEFTAVQTAVNTKADLNGSSGEAFSTSTAGASSNTTVAASTAYVTGAITGFDTKQNILDAIYPVGSLYISTASANPSTALGGTWVSFGQGKVLAGFDDAGTPDTDFDTGGETGGRKDSVLPEHTHGVTHTTVTEKVTGSFDGNSTHSNLNASASTETTTTAGVALTGNENLQPYIVVYMWKRTGL